MKSRTSFFNVTVLRKNLIRFAPVWVLYAVAEILGLMTLDLSSAGIVANDLRYIMGPVAICHMIYALIVAACLFGDLFDSRLCNGLHAMPLRREGWLLTNLISGFLFALIPAVAGGLVAAIALQEYYWIALLWQATSLLQFVFFFGVAVFSAMCAGKRLSMTAIYCLINFLSMLIFWIATLVYQPLLPGVVLSEESFSAFCPVVSMASHRYMDFYYDKILGGYFRGFMTQDLHYLYICAGLGLLFLALAWLLYRNRQLESAGDFISFRPMRMVFLLSYTFAIGSLVFAFTGVFFGMNVDYGFLVAGIVIGWFTGWMLLERNVKIFTKSVLVGFAAFAVVLAGSIGITALDPMGITTYVPQAQNVENACLYPMNERYYYYAQEGYEGRHLTDPAELETVLQLHQQMLETPEDPGAEYINMEIGYQMKNGRHVHRRYDVPTQSEVANGLEAYLSDMRSVFLVDDPLEVWESVNYAHVYYLDESKGEKDLELRDREQLQALLSAIEADCKAGNFAQHDAFHPDNSYVTGLDITWKLSGDTGRVPGVRSRHIIIYSDCENVLAFLETLAQNRK